MFLQTIVEADAQQTLCTTDRSMHNRQKYTEATRGIL